MSVQRVEISNKTIIFTVFFLLGLYGLWIVKDLLFSLLIAFILMSALHPLVDYLEKKKLNRILAITIVYIMFLFVLGVLMFIIIPPLLIETRALLAIFPRIIQDLSPAIGGFIVPEAFMTYIPNVTGQLFSILGGVFANAIFIVSTIFFSIYFLIEEGSIGSSLPRFFNKQTVTKINNVLRNAKHRMSSWFWGELILMFVVGIATYIGLSLLGFKHALSLAVLAGLFEVLPNLGPTLSAIPAVIIGFSQSPLIGFSTLALYVVIQQLENAIFVPLIMKKAVGINPIISLICLIVGGNIAGILGVLLAIPLFLIFETAIISWRDDKQIVNPTV